MKKILVTGATGKVGRRFVPRLVRWEGADAVRILVRDETKAADLAGLGVDVVQGDLREQAARVKALQGVDAVVNVAAALRGVPDEEAYAVNRDAAVELGRDAAEAGVRRFVQTSTNLVYRGGLGRPAVESDELRPDASWGAYAASKAQAEEELRELELPLVVVRLAFVYGEGDTHLAQSLQWAGQWASHQRLPVVHHADASQSLWRAVRTPGIEGRAYNAVDDAPITAYDLHELHGVPQPEGAAAREAGDPWEGHASNARIRAELGWRPLYPSVWTARDAGAL
ncbi:MULTISPECIES: NAD-dependent epimerase/dehydratase family protein [Kitasatospora]|uniref:NAD(P)-binding domain-containing protein n=1 Tax=Kitasatospora cystarginea TaxID=58350 RepID=A0ABN3EAL5_9ACTN